MINEWIQQKVFRYIHGHSLIYNTCWEDPRIDRQLLNLKKDSSVIMITSAGCNALDYLLAGAAKVTAVDMNLRQNALLELKVAAARSLSYDEFFLMFGRGRLHNPMKVYGTLLRHYLSPSAQAYWDRKMHYFSTENWRGSFYFQGTAGLFARMINLYLDKALSVRSHIDEILQATSLDSQRDLFNHYLKPKFWSPFLRWIVGRDSTLALIGVPRSQRQQVDAYYKGGIVSFMEDCVDAVFSKLPLNDNYFWRVYLKGEYSPTCCPEYLTLDGYKKIRNELWPRLSIHTGTFCDVLKERKDELFTHFVLLDHMDWLNAHHRDELAQEWQLIYSHAKKPARIIWRSGGLRVDFVDTLPLTVYGEQCEVGDVLVYQTEKARSLHELDRVHTYGSLYAADMCAV